MRASGPCSLGQRDRCGPVARAPREPLPDAGQRPAQPGATRPMRASGPRTQGNATDAGQWPVHPGETDASQRPAHPGETDAGQRPAQPGATRPMQASGPCSLGNRSRMRASGPRSLGKPMQASGPCSLGNRSRMRASGPRSLGQRDRCGPAARAPWATRPDAGQWPVHPGETDASQRPAQPGATRPMQASGPRTQGNTTGCGPEARAPRETRPDAGQRPAHPGKHDRMRASGPCSLGQRDRCGPAARAPWGNRCKPTARAAWGTAPGCKPAARAAWGNATDAGQRPAQPSKRHLSGTRSRML
jgi:hypothetical protein